MPSTQGKEGDVLRMREPLKKWVGRVGLLSLVVQVPITTQVPSQRGE